MRHKNSRTCHAAGRVSNQISKQLGEPAVVTGCRHIVDISQRAGKQQPTDLCLLLHRSVPSHFVSLRDKWSSMSQGSFVFTPMALRSLQQDADMLRTYECRRRLASRHLPSSYVLGKEARDGTPLRSRTAPPAAVCQDMVVQNALYTGNLEVLQELFPRGTRASLIIEPQGGDMRWVATGGGRKR